MRARHALLTVPFLTACGGPLAGPAGEHLGTASQADTTVCAAGTVLQGIDVYEGDSVDWSTAKANGIVFGIAKATEGLTITDSQFSTNWSTMKQEGIVRGAYHFFHCDDDPTTQANDFLGVMGTLEQGDLPPTLDFEDATCDPSTGVSLAITFLDAVAKATSTLPILYCSPGFLDGFDDTNSLAGHAQLWVADWGPSCPTVPSPFTDWPIWQYNDKGVVPGVNGGGASDVDEFNGDMAKLMGITLGGTGGSPFTGTGGGGTGGSGAPSCTANGVAGTCIDTSVCATMPGYISTPDLCPGPANEQCCTPTGTASTSGSGGAGGAPSSGSGSTASAGGATATSVGTSSSTSGGSKTGASTSGTGASVAASPNSSGSCAASGRAAGGADLGAGALAGLALLGMERRRRARAR